MTFPAYSQSYVNESFSSASGSAPPTGWSNVVGSNPGADPTQLWRFDNPGARTFSGANFDSNFAILDSDNYGSSGTQDAYLVTPTFSTTGNAVVKLRFSESFRSYSGSSSDIEISTNGGANWTNIRTLTSSLGYPDPAVQTEIDISTLAANQATVQVRFHYAGSWGYWWAIDNIQIFTPSATDIALSALLAPEMTGCYSANQNIAVKLKNEGSQSINFATTPATVTVAVTGAGTGNPSTVINTGTLGIGDSTIVLVTSTFNMSAPGIYVFKSSVSVSGDLNKGNDTLVKSITKTPLATLPETVDFTGFTGSNLTTVFPRWVESSGPIPTPSVTTSNWTSRNFANDAASPNGNSSVINLYSTSTQAWMVGPRFMATPNTQLKFDLALTTYYSTTAGNLGSDDTVAVMISTDCGTTWSVLSLYDASSSISNTGQTEMIDLSPFAGQEVIIGFYASEGTVDDTEDMDIFIDNINIVNVLATDIGASLVIPPVQNAGGCYGATETIQAKVKNYGLNPVDFSVTPAQVEVAMTGANTQTYNATISTGTLAPNAEITVTVTTTANMSANGTYNFRARTIFAGDAQASNDTSTAVQRINIPNTALPMAVNFTGYTGSNLATVFPGWSEGNGSFPALTNKNDASWYNGNFGYVPALPASNCSYINLYTTGKRAWIVSPKFRATPATQLEFDLALTLYAQTAAGNMGSDDTFMVAISTDCGQTFTSLSLYGAGSTISNTGQTEIVNLSAFAGQDVIIAFYASEGTVDDPEDVNLYIDNINIRELLSIDLAAVTRVSPVKKSCYSNAEPVVVRVRNTGSQTADFSVNPVTVTTTVNGAATTTLTQTVNSGTLASNATLDVVFSGTLDLSAFGTYYVRSYISCTGDNVQGNDSLSRDTLNHIAPAPLPQVLNFTGFTGSNLGTLYPGWYKASGYPFPNPASAGSWTATNYTNQATPNGTAIRINLYYTGKRSWFVSPKFTATAATELSFDLAKTAYNSTNSSNMGSDDSLVIFVSTDCGLSYSPLQVYDASSTISNTGQNESFNLSAFAGQNIIIGFYASEGVIDDPEDYDLFIDNINIKELSATDIGVTDILAPITGCGHTTNDTVMVTVRNFGTQPITNFTASYIFNNGTPVSENVTTLTILPGQSANYSFTTTVNLATTGTYGIKAYATLTGDVNATNDTTTRSILATGTVSTFPYLQDFEGTLTDWLVQPIIGANNWSIRTGGLVNPTLAAHSGTKIAFWNSYSYAAGNTSRLYAPCMDFSGMTNPTVQFYISQDAQYSTSADRVRIIVSLDKGVTWTTVDSVARYNAALTSAQWTKYRACLSSTANQPSVMIAIEAVSGNGNNIGMDDFQVYDFVTAPGVPSLVNDTICSSSNAAAMVANTSNEYNYTLVETGTLAPKSPATLGTGSTINLTSIQLTNSINLSILVTDTLTGCYVVLPLGQVTVNQNNLSGTIVAPSSASLNTPVPVVVINGPIGANFEWNFGADAMPSVATGEGPHNVEWSTIGTKTITLTITQNGCTLVINYSVTVGTTAISNSLTANNVSIYPNPSNGKLFVEMGIKPGEKVYLEITDLSGKVIYNQNIISDKQVELDLTQIPTGLYLLKLRYQESQLTQKLVIE